MTRTENEVSSPLAVAYVRCSTSHQDLSRAAQGPGCVSAHDAINTAKNAIAETTTSATIIVVPRPHLRPGAPQ